MTSSRRKPPLALFVGGSHHGTRRHVPTHRRLVLLPPLNGPGVKFGVETYERAAFAPRRGTRSEPAFVLAGIERDEQARLFRSATGRQQ